MDEHSAPPPYDAIGARNAAEPSKTGQTQATIVKVVPTNTRRLETLRLLHLQSRRLLRRNPGFCPGAFSYHKASRNCLKSYTLPARCTHCGLQPSKMIPLSYTRGWPEYQKYDLRFNYESHVPPTRKDETERRSCWVCWEKKGVWVEPMDLERWGLHVRTHFKDEGEWICATWRSGGMNARWQCDAEKCNGVHC